MRRKRRREFVKAGGRVDKRGRERTSGWGRGRERGKRRGVKS